MYGHSDTFGQVNMHAAVVVFCLFATDLSRHKWNPSAHLHSERDHAPRTNTSTPVRWLVVFRGRYAPTTRLTTIAELPNGPVCSWRLAVAGWLGMF